jgi:hypothetical protein
MVGFKLNGAKEMAQIVERRKELRTNLSLLQGLLEQEDIFAWIDDVTYDTKQRDDRIAQLESASVDVHSSGENALIEKGTSMFAIFENNSAGAKQLEHSESIMFSETKLNAATGLLLGRAAAMVRASPQEIIMYLLNYDSRHIASEFDPAVWVRSEVLQHVNAHHTIFFVRGKLGARLGEDVSELHRG